MFPPEAEISIRPRRWLALVIALAFGVGLVAVATVVTDALSEEGCGGG